MSKRVHKFATGEPIPDGAVYLNTVAQSTMMDDDPRNPPLTVWLVWHYFLVEVSDE